jgi:hypothetical protein
MPFTMSVEVKIGSEIQANPEFRITPKTTYDELIEFRGTNTTSPARGKVANDMIHNTMEICNGLDWNLLTQNIKYKAFDIDHKGKGALEMGYANSVLRVAIDLKVGMDDPQMVFLSGYFFTRVLEERERHLSQEIRKIGNERKFLTPEDEERAKEREGTQLESVSANLYKLRERVKAYADTTFTQRERATQLVALTRLIRQPSGARVKQTDESRISEALHLYKTKRFAELLAMTDEKPLY